MSRTSGERKNVKNEILSTAAALFNERGVHATSLQDIAEAAGIVKGTLYYYYPAKEELVLAIAAAAVHARADALFFWVDSLERDMDEAEAFKALFLRLTEDESALRLYVALLMAGGSESPALSDMLSAARREWRVMFELGALKLRSLPQKELSRRGELFFTLLDGYCLSVISKTPTMDVDVVISSVLS